ncbi:uncharacterized protein LOC116657487 isoform X1 [Camelus ferus]|uniref:Uncharacterized protein LOC116657487 isoform X1 n=1 Tax=Camelus ferus TaxID=419612 RepID=A0A8B8RCI8_CAMFR|nr:uncharacterized protein LOC116657487 isoform X1 [Camelus ferus]XP_032315699.1 uncharacterized protein LOC116657487 isoform X1 [Camelus ferus]XP_032315700.1 uncharacterized protein LOC116657487 isoform X1 [Camelus ferus]XP_032315701.1 uncharacterized protein LOC116657487 isoform X1 [Camelus ferus]XP_032315703.1 uncharacterized protein LOC116657487 isoform X1 [Camelus ferus]XP_032315704.1 uncharacterized protein LOC116657487 isoform X1 [Camelus ferus]XP_032315705.1 uncharacterized protein LO
MCACQQACAGLCTQACVRVCAYVCTCAHPCVHTHTHTWSTCSLSSPSHPGRFLCLEISSEAGGQSHPCTRTLGQKVFALRRRKLFFSLCPEKKTHNSRGCKSNRKRRVKAGEQLLFQISVRLLLKSKSVIRRFCPRTRALPCVGLGTLEGPRTAKRTSTYHHSWDLPSTVLGSKARSRGATALLATAHLMGTCGSSPFKASLDLQETDFHPSLPSWATELSLFLRPAPLSPEGVSTDFSRTASGHMDPPDRRCPSEGSKPRNLCTFHQNMKEAGGLGAGGCPAKPDRHVWTEGQPRGCLGGWGLPSRAAGRTRPSSRALPPQGGEPSAPSTSTWPSLGSHKDLRSYFLNSPNSPAPHPPAF